MSRARAAMLGGRTTPIGLLVLALAVGCWGCSDSQTPSAATSTPLSSIDLARVKGTAAVYLLVGDDLAQTCCPAFADYLAQKLNREVTTVNLAGDESSSDLITGVNHVGPSQLDRAVAAIKQYAADGHPVAAVTLATGLKDFERQVASCGDATDSCREEFESQLLTPFSERLGLILSRILSAGTPAPPILFLNYGASCLAGTSGPFTIDDVNRTIAEAALQTGVKLIDISQAPEACVGLTGATPGATTIDYIERELETVYEALPQ